MVKLEDKSGANQGCWMAQNLAYSITQEMIDKGEINSDNTALVQNDSAQYEEINGKLVWNAKSVHPPVPTFDLGATGELTALTADPEAAWSWSFGPVIFSAPGTASNCANVANPLLCPTKFANVGSYAPALRNGDPGDIRENRIPLKDYVVLNNSQMAYDAHFEIGNYYQFNTAAAGSATGLSGDDFVSSICPKGWIVPTTTESRSKMSWAAIVNYYYGRGVGGVNGVPTFFQRVGTIASTSGLLTYAGGRTYLWSSYAASDKTASFFSVSTSSSSIPSNNRNYVRPMRCAVGAE